MVLEICGGGEALLGEASMLEYEAALLAAPNIGCTKVSCGGSRRRFATACVLAFWRSYGCFVFPRGPRASLVPSDCGTARLCVSD